MVRTARETTPTERLRLMESDRDIGRWIKDHRTESTASVQLEQLELFCRRVGKNPHELVRLAKKPREYQDLVMRWIDEQRKAGRPDSYLAANYAAVRSWLRANDTIPAWRPKLKVRAGTTIANETVPTAEQLRRVLGLLGARGRVSALLMATSGIRPGVLACRFTTGGLRLRDLLDLKLSPTSAEFARVPFLIQVPAELSKNGRTYITFGGHEAADAILTYLTERRAPRRNAPGEILTPASPLITIGARVPASHVRRAVDGAVFIDEWALAYELRRALSRVAPEGTRWRPYVLRSWFSTQLLLAESRGAIVRDVRESFLGHDLGVSGRYNLGKTLPPHVIDELRDAYSRCEPFLAVLSSTRDESGQARREFREMVGTMLGLSESDKEHIENLSPSEVGEFVRERLRGPARQPQRIVSVGEAEGLLASGWEATTALSDGRLVVRAPSVTMQDHPRLPTLMRQPGGGE